MIDNVTETKYNRRGSVTVYFTGPEAQEAITRIRMAIRDADEQMNIHITSLNTTYTSEEEKPKEQVRDKDRTTIKEA